MDQSDNQPPLISVSSPASESSYPDGAAIPFSATVSDPDGTVDRVSFYVDFVLYSTQYSSPYGIWFPEVAPGVHTLTVVAWDNAGASTTSAAHSHGELVVFPTALSATNGSATDCVDHGSVVRSSVHRTGVHHGKRIGGRRRYDRESRLLRERNAHRDHHEPPVQFLVERGGRRQLFADRGRARRLWEHDGLVNSRHHREIGDSAQKPRCSFRRAITIRPFITTSSTCSLAEQIPQWQTRIECRSGQADNHRR